MLHLSERHVKVPEPRQVDIDGDTYSVWSLLEGRVRVMRVGDVRANGEKAGVGWARYCAQLLWHGEPFVYQSCCRYLRFAPGWDAGLRQDLDMAQRKSQNKTVLSWAPEPHSWEPWNWVSKEVDYDGHANQPTGTLVATGFDKDTAWVQFRGRHFSHVFGAPPHVAFFTAENVFSSSELLTEAPADPSLYALKFHGQLTCENVRLFSHGWDVFSPTACFTWQSFEDARKISRCLSGVVADPLCENPCPSSSVFEPQKERADACLERWENPLTSLDDAMLHLPVPTACFWTALVPAGSNPWETGHIVGHRFRRSTKRGMSAFERHTGLDMSKRETSTRSMTCGLNEDRDFADSEAAFAEKLANMSPEELEMIRGGAHD